MAVQRSLNTILEGLKTDAGHAVGDGDGGQVAASIEGTIADTGHAVWDGDGGQTAAPIEGIVADAGHTVRDCDGGQAAAITEGIVADAGHAVDSAFIGNGAGDSHFARVAIIIIIRIRVTLVGYYCFVAREVVVNAVDVSIVGQCGCCACKEAKAQEDVPEVVLFHCFYKEKRAELL